MTENNNANVSASPDAVKALAVAPNALELGIGADVRSSRTLPFIPSAEVPIQVGILIGVDTKLVSTKNEGDKQVLNFTFQSLDGTREYVFTEWELDVTGEDFSKRLASMQERIKHIYVAYATFPAAGLKGGKTFKELFENMAAAFNTGGEGNTPIYTKAKKTWLKLVYIIKYPNVKLGFPLSPNFIERVIDNKPTTLYINTQYETLVPPVRTSRNPLPNANGGAGAGFGEAPSGFPPFKTPTFQQ